MKMRALILCLLLATTTVVAAAATDLVASEVRVSDAEFQAQLAILKLLAGDHVPPAGFELAAASLRLEEDRAALVVETVQRTYIQPSMTRTSFEEVSVVGTDNGVEARWALDPIPGEPSPTVGFDSSCVVVSASNQRSEVTPAMISDRRPERATDVSQTLVPHPCSGSLLVTVTGTFRLSLWDWNATLTYADGSHPINTGLHSNGDGTTGATEAYLFVQNGTLTIPITRTPTAFFLADATVTAAEATLQRATGTLDVGGTPRTLEAENVDLPPDVLLEIAGTGVNEPLRVAVTPAPATSTTVAPRTPGDTTALVAALVGMAVVAAAYLHARPHIRYLLDERRGRELGPLVPQNLRERRAVGLWLMARRAESRGHYWLSQRRAAKSNALFTFFYPAKLARAVAALQRKQFTNAISDFHDVYFNDFIMEAGVKPQSALGLALAYTRMGQTDAAREWLITMAMEDLGFAQKNSTLRDFDVFEGNEWFDNLRAGKNAEDSVWGPKKDDPSFA